jgi:hypothetical protein
MRPVRYNVAASIEVIADAAHLRRLGISVLEPGAV